MYKNDRKCPLRRVEARHLPRKQGRMMGTFLTLAWLGFSLIFWTLVGLASWATDTGQWPSHAIDAEMIHAGIILDQIWSAK